MLLILEGWGRVDLLTLELGLAVTLTNMLNEYWLHWIEAEKKRRMVVPM